MEKVDFGCGTCPVRGAGCVRALQDEWVRRNDLPCRLLPTTDAHAIELTRRKADARREFLDEIGFEVRVGLFFGIYVVVLTWILVIAFGGGA
jgi:hypothetical protein